MLLWLRVCISGQNLDVEPGGISLGFRLVCQNVSALLVSISVDQLVLGVHWRHSFDGGILLT